MNKRKIRRALNKLKEEAKKVVALHRLNKYQKRSD